MTFNIGNPNATALTGVAFTDNLPAGLVVATPNALVNGCAGTAVAVAGTSTVSLSGGNIAANCTITLNVIGTTAGVKVNSVTVTDTTAGTGNTSTATLNVVNAPTLTKAFADTTLQLFGAGTTLTFTISNPGTTPLAGIAFSDTLSPGAVIASPDAGLVTTCAGATITAPPGGPHLHLAT